MASEIKRKEEMLRKAKTMVALLANLSSLAAIAVSVFIEFSRLEFKLFPYYIVLIASAFMGFLVAVTLVTVHFKNASVKVSTLKKNMSKSFLNALDLSDLNPKKKGELFHG